MKIGFGNNYYLMSPIPPKGIPILPSFEPITIGREPPPQQSTRPNKDFPDAPTRTFDEVFRAFAPLSGSKAAQYADMSLMSERMMEVWGRIPQRKAESDRMAASLVQGRIAEYQMLGGLLIVNSGGPHSIAIAVTLAETGYQPVIKIGKRYTQNDLVNLQTIAAMKFYAPRMEEAIIRMTEGRGNELVKQRDDWTPSLLEHYRSAGMTLYQHVADPYYEGTPAYSVRLLPE